MKGYIGFGLLTHILTLSHKYHVLKTAKLAKKNMGKKKEQKKTNKKTKKDTEENKRGEIEG